MNKNEQYIYLVEGENEKLFINAIKNKYIVSGKVFAFNALTKNISSARLMTWENNTNVIIIFDTDVYERACVQCLRNNIKVLERAKNIKNIFLVTQVKNFEDELIRATSISSITQFTNSKSNKDFKRDFNRLGNNLIQKLNAYNFDVNQLWVKKASGNYKEFENMANKIKLRE